MSRLDIGSERSVYRRTQLLFEQLSRLGEWDSCFSYLLTRRFDRELPISLKADWRAALVGELKK